MRKHLLLTWLLVLALFLCACSAGGETPSAPTTTSATTTTTTDSTATETTTTTETVAQTTTVTDTPTSVPTTTLRPTTTTTKRPTTATTTQPSAPRSYRAWYDLGNCGTLTRNPTLVVLFVDDAESAWNDTLIQHFQNVQIAKAVDWLEQQAAKHNVPLDIQTKFYHGTLDNGGKV